MRSIMVAHMPLLPIFTDMKKCIFTVLLLAVGCLDTWAQQPDTLTAPQPLQEVLITGIRDAAIRETAINLSALRREQIERTGAATLCDALAAMPGVSMLHTGPGIAKPVVRGLYGNRVLVLLSSLKFDNQQWQDEHGLGLSTVGIDRVELIKGPASVLYGSEAVGGVINIIEERPEPDLPHQGDVNLRLYSNTQGINGDAGLLGNTRTGWWRVRAGADSHTDYSDGKGDRVLNSRFGGFYLKGTLAFRNTRRQMVVNYSGSLSRFGFIVDDLVDFFDADARRSRSFAGPHHSVALNVLSVENTYWKQRGLIKVNAGLQSNLRREDEGGGAVSLNMHLLSLPYNAQWIRPINKYDELIVSITGSLEQNTNYGARIIVPDANMAEQGLSLFYRHRRGSIVLEGGLGAQDKFIQTLETRLLNTPDKELRPFKRNRASLNGLLGLAWNPSAQWSFKWNAATGFRAPNLAELSSNGLHEGIFHYEIGDPNLRNEQNLNAEMGLLHESRLITVNIAMWVNQFRNYVYLAPTGKDTLGFPLYRYRQDDARLYGAEIETTWHLSAWHWTNAYTFVRGTRHDDAPLPFVQAPKWVSRLRWEHSGGKTWQKPWCTVAGEYIFAQNRPAEYETATPPYFLLQAGLGAELHYGNNTIVLSLTGRNLLDRRYADHLSRLKAFNIYDMGRTVELSVRVPFRF
mgnify:CR=1 FL=1